MAESKAREARAPWCQVLVGVVFTSGLIAAPSLVSANEAPRPQHAKQHFGYAAGGSPNRPAALGFYTNGCLAGGVALPVTGRSWEALRVWRNRHWGHPKMIRFIKEFAEQARAPGWPGLLIGDISQPRGGPMLSGHRSHQVGLDVDIRYEAKPNRPLSAYERATISGYRLAGPRDTEVNENWKRGHERVLRIAAKDPRVQRILTHPSVKKKLCETVRGDRSWLRKVRPVFGHNYHFHIRLFCPRGTPGCRAQKAVTRGDGCGKSLDYMLKRVAGKIRPPARPKPKPGAKPWIHSIDKLPAACRTILTVDRPQLLARSVAPRGGRAPRPVRNPVRR